MMTSALSLTTPALLFPTVSLLLLAYTNRFLGLASIIRTLYDDYQNNQNPKILRQIGNLRTRITLIKWMQFLGITSLFMCSIAMFQIYAGWQTGGELVFGASLLCMIGSLAISLFELVRSSDALNILLSDLQAEYDRCN
ncbi:DUF2721 domain-containing protein [Neisseriaceae bacterium TC5R-5]|nr:DUF2721 domain-containing protein [Neisseriaceae bacterium TC5R-5]